MSFSNPFDQYLFNIASQTWTEYLNKLGNERKVIKMQCFPLYSILKAIGETHVDYLSLDIGKLSMLQ